MNIKLKRTGAGHFLVADNGTYALIRAHGRGDWGVAFRDTNTGRPLFGQEPGDEDSATSFGMAKFYAAHCLRTGVRPRRVPWGEPADA